jgi:hypothetical protein
MRHHLFPSDYSSPGLAGNDNFLPRMHCEEHCETTVQTIDKLIANSATFTSRVSVEHLDEIDRLYLLVVFGWFDTYDDHPLGWPLWFELEVTSGIVNPEKFMSSWNEDFLHR